VPIEILHFQPRPTTTSDDLNELLIQVKYSATLKRQWTENVVGNEGKRIFLEVNTGDLNSQSP
jgi:hypothetical protein